MILFAYDSTNNISYNFMVTNYLVIIKQLIEKIIIVNENFII